MITNDMYESCLLHAERFCIYFARDSCRFLWKRIPNPASRKKDVTLQAVWAIGKSLWMRNNEATFAAISAFRSSNQGPSTLSTLVDILYGKFFLRIIQIGLSAIR